MGYEYGTATSYNWLSYAIVIGHCVLILVVTVMACKVLISAAYTILFPPWTSARSFKKQLRTMYGLLEASQRENLRREDWVTMRMRLLKRRYGRSWLKCAIRDLDRDESLCGDAWWHGLNDQATMSCRMWIAVSSGTKRTSWYERIKSHAHAPS